MGRKHFFQENFERQLVGWEADGGQYLLFGAAEILFAGDTAPHYWNVGFGWGVPINSLLCAVGQ